MLRNSAGALKDFERAISLSPYSAHMYFNRANLHTSLKDYQKAETDYSKGESIVTADVMHQSMWINRVPPWADPGDSDIWFFFFCQILHPHFHLLSQNPLYFLPQEVGISLL